MENPIIKKLKESNRVYDLVHALAVLIQETEALDTLRSLADEFKEEQISMYDEMYQSADILEILYDSDNLVVRHDFFMDQARTYKNRYVYGKCIIKYDPELGMHIVSRIDSRVVISARHDIQNAIDAAFEKLREEEI